MDNRDHSTEHAVLLEELRLEVKDTCEHLKEVLKQAEGLNASSPEVDVKIVIQNAEEAMKQVDGFCNSLDPLIATAMKWIITRYKNLQKREDVIPAYIRDTLDKDLAAVLHVKDDIVELYDLLQDALNRVIESKHPSTNILTLSSKIYLINSCRETLEIDAQSIDKYLISSALKGYFSYHMTMLRENVPIDSNYVEGLISTTEHLMEFISFTELSPDEVGCFWVTAEKSIARVLKTMELSDTQTEELNRVLSTVQEALAQATSSNKAFYHNAPPEFYHKLESLDFWGLIQSGEGVENGVISTIEQYEKLRSMVDLGKNPEVYYMLFPLEVAMINARLSELLADRSFSFNKDDDFNKLKNEVQNIFDTFSRTTLVLLKSHKGMSFVSAPLDTIAGSYIIYNDQTRSQSLSLLFKNALSAYSAKCLSIKSSHVSVQNKNKLLDATHARYLSFFKLLSDAMGSLQLGKSCILKTALLSNPMGLEMLDPQKLKQMKESLQSICKTLQNDNVPDVKDIMVRSFSREVVDSFTEAMDVKSQQLMESWKQKIVEVATLYPTPPTKKQQLSKAPEVTSEKTTYAVSTSSLELEGSPKKKRKKKNHKHSAKKSTHIKQSQNMVVEEAQAQQDDAPVVPVPVVQNEDLLLNEARMYYSQGDRDNAEAKLQDCIEISKANKNWYIALSAKHAQITYSLNNIKEQQRWIINYKELASRSVPIYNKKYSSAAIRIIGQEINAVMTALNDSEDYLENLFSSNMPSTAKQYDKTLIVKSIHDHTQQLEDFVDMFEMYLKEQNVTQALGVEEFRDKNPELWKKGDAKTSAFVEARKAREECIISCSKFQSLSSKVKSKLRSNKDHSNNMSGIVGAPIEPKIEPMQELKCFLSKAFSSNTDSVRSFRIISSLHTAAHTSSLTFLSSSDITQLVKMGVCNANGELLLEIADFVRTNVHKMPGSHLRFEYQGKCLSM